MKIIPVFRDYDGCMTYIVIDKKSGKGVLIDAGQPDDIVLGLFEKEKSVCEAVLLTHGHFDHIGYLDAIKEKTGCKVYIHAYDADKLADPVGNVSNYFYEKVVSYTVPEVLKENDKICIGNLVFDVIHTPGHTQGCVCYLCSDNEDTVLFSGDTLFNDSVGRWDFPGGDRTILFNSIRNLCDSLPNETPVFPGHGESTTIGKEVAENVFLRTDW